MADIVSIGAAGTTGIPPLSFQVTDVSPDDAFAALLARFSMSPADQAAPGPQTPGLLAGSPEKAPESLIAAGPAVEFPMPGPQPPPPAQADAKPGPDHLQPMTEPPPSTPAPAQGDPAQPRASKPPKRPAEASATDPRQPQGIPDAPPVIIAVPTANPPPPVAVTPRAPPNTSAAVPPPQPTPILTAPLQAGSPAAPPEPAAAAAAAGPAKGSSEKMAPEQAAPEPPQHIITGPPAQVPPAGHDALRETAPAAPPDPAHRAPPAEQIAPALVSVMRSRDGGQEVTIRLDPAELGHVRISIERTASGTAHVNITAERADTMQLLLRDQPRLEQMLNQAGIPPENRSLHFHTVPPAASGGLDGDGRGADTNQSRGQSAWRDAPRDRQREQPHKRWFREGLDITA